MLFFGGVPVGERHVFWLRQRILKRNWRFPLIQSREHASFEALAGKTSKTLGLITCYTVCMYVYISRLLMDKFPILIKQ